MQYQDRSLEYIEDRGPTEIDLLEIVENLLAESGLFNTKMILRDYFIKNQVVDKKPNVQRFYMNKFFQIQLLVMETNTIEQRFCLITDGTVEDWLNLFKRKILPFLRENLNA